MPGHLARFVVLLFLIVIFLAVGGYYTYMHPKQVRKLGVHFFPDHFDHKTFNCRSRKLLFEWWILPRVVEL